MKPDLLTTWPVHCDYPVWRRWLMERRADFGRIIISFSEHHDGTDNFSGYVQQQLRPIGAEFVWSPPEPGRDWRDAAIRGGLARSDAEWVWFTEQDFSAECWPCFWRIAKTFSERADVIGIKEGDRWHPASLFVRRAALDAAPRYYGPEKEDHFIEVTDALQAEGWRFRQIGRGHWQHMNGLSHNHALVARGEPVTYKPEEFRDYLRACLEVECEPRWRAQVECWLADA